MTVYRFVDELPLDVTTGWYAHYEHRQVEGQGWTVCDVRGLLRERQEQWLDAFDDWHAELCRLALRRSPWWWFTPASRPNIWVQQGMLKPLFYAAAVHEWHLAHPGCTPIYLVGCPVPVRLHLREFEQQGGPSALEVARVFLRQWRALFRSAAGLGARLVRYAGTYAIRRPPSTEASILFYSHVVQARALQAGDHFFDGIIEAVEAERPGQVLLGYVLDHEGEREQAHRILQASGRRSVFVLDYLSLWDALWAFLTGLRLCLSLGDLVRTAPPLRLASCRSWLFGRWYVVDQLVGQAPGTECAVYRALRRLLGRAQIRAVIYPYEEKAVERVILQACVEARAPIRTLAYAHAAHTTCHVALRTRPNGFSNPPQPDVLLTTGATAKDFLIRWGRKDAAKVVVIGSPRYTKPLARTSPPGLGERPLRVLVLISHGFELQMLANFLDQRPDLFAEADVVIRRYPFLWLDVQDRAMARIVAVSDRVKVGTEPLLEQFAWCDVALFSSTSTGLQAMVGGRLAIYVGLHDIWEADPLLGYDAGVERCATADQLADALARAHALTGSAYTRLVHAQRAFGVSIFAPVASAPLLEYLAQGEAPSRAKTPHAEVPSGLAEVSVAGAF